jgi:hypothetical protein
MTTEKISKKSIFDYESVKIFKLYITAKMLIKLRQNKNMIIHISWTLTGVREKHKVFKGRSHIAIKLLGDAFSIENFLSF